jgi:ubiquinone/menaquinone biosynthesis C-methylase UbiE
MSNKPALPPSDKESDFDLSYENIHNATKNRFSENKLISYKSINKNMRYYKSVNSKQQIRSIVDNGKLKDYYRLCLLISKFIHGNNTYIRKFIERTLAISSQYNNNNNSQKTTSDDSIYYLLGEQIKRENRKEDLIVNNSRDNTHVDLYYEHINTNILQVFPSFKINKYLDIGCGTCSKTSKLGAKLGLTKEQIFGTDLENWSNFESEVRNTDNFNFTVMPGDNTLPYPSQNFDLISAFMVLHHVEKLDLLLKEIDRCLKKGGFFIMREHDAYTAFDYMLTDIEHIIYEAVIYKKSTDTYFAKYYNWYEFDTILARYGLKFIAANYDSPGPIFDISPTRYFYGIYQKV